MNSVNELEWLQSYYLECCNGDWEHAYGIKIGTVDNPGWMLTIDLADTTLEDFESLNVEYDKTEDDWYFCYIKNKKFEGRGGPKNLSDLIRLFRKWVEECDKALAEKQ